MATISVSTYVAASPETVFGVATDIERLPGRIKGITKIEKLTPGPVGVGTRFRETRIMLKREATEEFEFTAFEANRTFTLECESCGCHYTVVHRLEPENSGTRMTMEFRTKARSFMAKLFAPLGYLMKGMMKKCLVQDLDGVKAASESESAPV